MPIRKVHFLPIRRGPDSEGSYFCQSGRVKLWQSGGVPNRRGPVLCQSGGVPEIRSDPEESKKFYFYEGNRTDPTRKLTKTRYIVNSIKLLGIKLTKKDRKPVTALETCF